MRFQELENITKRLEEELSTEKSDKDVFVEEAGKMCDQVNEDLCALKESFQNISEEHRELVEKLTHYKNHVTNETSNHTDEMRLISNQEKIVILDRIPNGLEIDYTLASFHDQATSPGETIHFDFEGKIEVDEFTLQAILATNRGDAIGGGVGGGVLRDMREGSWNVPFVAF
ncbi:hypothetical protein OS493_022010 [Desmophyllum pertusum]|uniref:Uncharacterized protein n=1 Tax=Desmophyllum pertusum TaxID=174260 RepID=A0A9W9YYE7_9CNID|nr:hypothetical protein OS493_022010 [Desmophyllum pertusum]